MITVDGVRYKSIETLPFCGVGLPAKMLSTPEGERVAVKRGGRWVWWKAQDKLQPVGHMVGQQLEPLSPDQYTDNLLAHGIIDWRNVE